MRELRTGDSVMADGKLSEVVGITLCDTEVENIPWDACDADVGIALADGRMVSGDKVKKIFRNHNTNPNA